MRTPLWFPVALLATALLVSLLMARTTLAQVAAPQLNPLTSESDNSAILAWQYSSFVGGAYLDIAIDSKPAGGPTTEFATGDGTVVGGRYVGEMFAVGAEVFNAEVETTAGETFEGEAVWAGVAGRLGDVLAIGIGQESGKDTYTQPGVQITEESTLPTVGVSVRLAEAIYIGAAVGDETIEETANAPAIPFFSSGEGDRRVTRVGIGYSMRDGESGVHLEFYREERDAIDAAITADSSELDGITAELLFANVLLGVERTSDESFDAVTGAVTEESDATALLVGWIPLEGLNVIATVGSEETVTDPTTGDGEEFMLAAIAVGWSF